MHTADQISKGVVRALGFLLLFSRSRQDPDRLTDDLGFRPSSFSGETFNEAFCFRVDTDSQRHMTPSLSV